VEGSVAAMDERCEVTILDTGETFVCDRDVPVLKAMVALGRRGIPSGCHGGGCGVCKIKVVAGQYRTGPMSREHVSEAEEEQGIALACRTYPLTALRVEVLGKMRKAVANTKRYGFV
jgi:ferredoxin